MSLKSYRETPLKGSLKISVVENGIEVEDLTSMTERELEEVLLYTTREDLKYEIQRLLNTKH